MLVLVSDKNYSDGLRWCEVTFGVGGDPSLIEVRYGYQAGFVSFLFLFLPFEVEMIKSRRKWLVVIMLARRLVSVWCSEAEVQWSGVEAFRA